MRRAFMLFAVLGTLQLSAGCKVVTGVCDCGEVPGEGVPLYPPGTGHVAPAPVAPFAVPGAAAPIAPGAATPRYEAIPEPKVPDRGM